MKITVNSRFTKAIHLPSSSMVYSTRESSKKKATSTYTTPIPLLGSTIPPDFTIPPTNPS